MKTKTSRTHKFLVLVPHRDIRVELQKYCDSAVKAALIKAPITGVYPFPRVTPLASLSQALDDSELKQIARSLRTHIGKNKINAEGDAVSAFPCNKEELDLCGAGLDIVIPKDIFKNSGKKISYVFPSIIIGCFLKPKDNTKLGIFREAPQKKLGFRAAAVANMYWKKLQINGEICYKWKIGKLCWLPRP
jgi:hypothetical protein